MVRIKFEFALGMTKDDGSALSTSTKVLNIVVPILVTVAALHWTFHVI